MINVRLVYLMFRWCMEEQTLASTMEQILALENLTTNQISPPMIMYDNFISLPAIENPLF